MFDLYLCSSIVYTCGVIKSDFSEQLEQKEATVTLAYGEGGPDNQGEVFYTEDEEVPIKVGMN
jgi:hypothetical protein